MKLGKLGLICSGLGLLMLASTIREIRPEWSENIRYFDEEQLGEKGCREAVLNVAQ